MNFPRSEIELGYDLTVAMAMIFTLIVGFSYWRSGPELDATLTNEPQRTKLLFHPLVQFLLICVLLWINQLFFSAYILSAHAGKTAFLRPYFGDGWFAIDRHSHLVRAIAAHAGNGNWLSPSLLRIQAFLELPFVVFGYLAIAHMLGHRLYQALVKPTIVVLVCLSYTAALALAELSLRNPWTADDLILRGAAAIFVPAYVVWISRSSGRKRVIAPAVEPGPTDLPSLLLFVAGAGAICFLILAAYDVFLLYNLAHFGAYKVRIIIAITISGLVAFAIPRWKGIGFRRSSGTPVSPGIEFCVSTLSAFVLLFFIPALSLRYAGLHAAGWIGGAIVAMLAVACGFNAWVRRASSENQVFNGVLSLGASLVAAVFGGGLAAAWASPARLGAALMLTPSAEMLLVRIVIVTLLVSLTVFRLCEISISALLRSGRAA